MRYGDVDHSNAHKVRLALALALFVSLLAALAPAAANASSSINVNPALPTDVSVGDTNVQGYADDHERQRRRRRLEHGLRARRPGAVHRLPGHHAHPVVQLAGLHAELPAVGRQPRRVLDPPDRERRRLRVLGQDVQRHRHRRDVREGALRARRRQRRAADAGLGRAGSTFSSTSWRSPPTARRRAGYQTLQSAEAAAYSNLGTGTFSRNSQSPVNVTLAAPSVTSTDPASPANDNAPEVKGTAPALATQVRIYTNASCTGVDDLAGQPGAFTTTGLTAPVNDNTTTTFYAAAVDNLGGISDCSTTSVTYIEDSIAPDTPTVSDFDPDSPANDNAPRVKGLAEAGSTVRIYTNATCTGAVAASGSAAAFASPGLLSSVANDSSTTFYATATDAAGLVSPCSAGMTYVEDSTAPIAPVLTADASGVSRQRQLAAHRRHRGSRVGREALHELRVHRPARGHEHRGDARLPRHRGAGVRQHDDDVLRDGHRRGRLHLAVLGRHRLRGGLDPAVGCHA